MWASATLRTLLKRSSIKLSYPLKCGLLQPYKAALLESTPEVVIPTQMWASATQLDLTPMKSDESCHTHSNVGFCNLMTDSYLRS